jgi:hypothetical protein
MPPDPSLARNRKAPIVRGSCVAKGSSAVSGGIASVLKFLGDRPGLHSGVAEMFLTPEFSDDRGVRATKTAHIYGVSRHD